MASGELQGWYQDPFGLHEKRYISAILSSGKPFGTLWTEVGSTSGNAYQLIPCIKKAGNWYVYLSPSS
jgi:hypothetical protein